MKKLMLLTAVLIGFINVNAQNPFAQYGYEPKIATLSQGQFIETFDNDTIVKIGSVLFNTKSKQIVAFMQTDTMYSEATLQPDVISRWLSPDPLADHPTQIGLTPYHFGGNNPIYWTDPDGRCPWCLVWAAVEVGLAVYDAYETGATIIDPKASTSEKLAAAGGFVLGAILPGGGYGAGAKQTAKQVDKIMDAGKVADKVNDTGKSVNKGADFIVSPNGNTAATSQSRMKKGFEDAGFPQKKTESPGTEFTLPDGNSVRTMDASGQQGKRAVFQNKNGQPVNQDFKSVNPPKDLSKSQKKDYVRDRTHLPQKD